jgi:hypothetical protein
LKDSTPTKQLRYPCAPRLTPRYGDKAETWDIALNSFGKEGFGYFIFDPDGPSYSIFLKQETVFEEQAIWVSDAEPEIILINHEKILVAIQQDLHLAR